MVTERQSEALSASGSCRPEIIPPDVLETLRKFERGETFDSWSPVRDYDVGQDVLKLFSKNRNGTDLKEFLVHGKVNVCKEKVIELIMHMSHRERWDDTYIEHEEISSDGFGGDLIFSASKYPFPLAKRTYIIKRSVHGSMDNTVLIYSKVIPYDYPKKYKWSTQVDDFESVLMIRNCADKEGYSEMLVTYYEDPKVMLPNTYLNLIIETLVPKVLNKMIIACKQYGSPTYMEYCRGMVCIPFPEKYNA
ncbi:putative Phosphatidylcholine transfer protein [Babesia divergens]|uniref:Phosphatidylcholine transfer protein n=1 Tax=Babesia divergens TaxID=32595 RepID=A0AAD9GHL8_BABDI|nr:putative Phosphatidylcholine transfer protein [Babesia divergens]